MRRLIAPLLFLAATGLFATDPSVLPLSLEEATRRALAKNQDIAIEREALVQSDEAVNAGKGAYDPLLGLDTAYHQLTGAINSVLSGAPPGLLGPETKTFSLSGSIQQLLPTGGTVEAFATFAHDKTDNQFVILSPAWGTGLGIRLRQPLLQNLAIDPARRAIRIAAANRDGETAHMRRTITDTVAAVETLYWTLVGSRRNIEVIQSSVDLAVQQLNETKIRIDAGVLGKTELAQPTAELERRRGNLAEVRDRASRVATSLKLLMFADPTDPDWERALVPTDEPTTPPIRVDVPEAIATAMKNRPEVAEVGAVIARSGIDVESREGELKPRLDFLAGYTGHGLAGSPNPGAIPIGGVPIVVPDPVNGGLGRSLGTIWEGRFPDYSFGFSFAFPILNRTAKANLAAARSQQRQAQLSDGQIAQRIVGEVRDAAFGLETARQRLEAAAAGRAASETQLFAEQERFGVGLSTNFFVLTRQNDLTNARVNEVLAQTDYRRAAAELARSTGTLLEERHIRFSEAEGSH